MIRRRVIVDGRVQGVWFRESCRGEAESHGVAGYVHNRPDGRVEAEFEGPEPAVDAMVDWCRRGPSRAVVTSVEVADVPPTGDTRFAVR